MEYTVDKLEKTAVSQIARAKILGKIFTAQVSSADPVGGIMPIRLDLKDAEIDSGIETEERLQLAVYDDAEYTTLSTDISLNNATEGTLLSGAGTAAIYIKTSATGGFACDAICASSGVTRYLVAISGGVPGGRIMEAPFHRTLVYP